MDRLISSPRQFGLSEQKITLTIGLCIGVLFPGLGRPHDLVGQQWVSSGTHWGLTKVAHALKTLDSEQPAWSL